MKKPESAILNLIPINRHTILEGVEVAETLGENDHIILEFNIPGTNNQTKSNQYLGLMRPDFDKLRAQTSLLCK